MILFKSLNIFLASRIDSISKQAFTIQGIELQTIVIILFKYFRKQQEYVLEDFTELIPAL